MPASLALLDASFLLERRSRPGPTPAAGRARLHEGLGAASSTQLSHDPPGWFVCFS